MSSEEIPGAVEARPWSPDDGPAPRVTTWPRTNRPALRVYSHGVWRYATIEARQDWADGRVFYQVSVDLRGDTHVTTRLYQWPQPGLRASHAPRPEAAGETGPTPPPTRPRR
ncbi:hypothetical protein AB0K02_24400 [Streptomyces sp. NPDC049597]|uniref:hypothetical protein n=1 Tax=Streptomyces sp. NPDC049597 TaxID=3155276 RepID=UPI0034187932